MLLSSLLTSYISSVQSLIYFPGQLDNQLPKLPNIYKCFKCGETKPTISCNNCAKMFHNTCVTNPVNLSQNVKGVWICLYCIKRNKNQCGKCQTQVGQLKKYLKTNQMLQQNNQNQKQKQNYQNTVIICTLCCKLFHKQCTSNYCQLDAGQKYQFFNPKSSYICEQCLQNRHFYIKLSNRIIKEDTFSYIQIIKQSPIHRTWINQQTYPKIPKSINHHQIIKNKQKYNITIVNENITNQNSFKVDKILCVKVPWIYRMNTKQIIIQQIKDKIKGEKLTDYGDVSNYWFLVKWATGEVSWQEQNVVISFQHQLSKFVSLLQYQIKQGSEAYPLTHNKNIKNLQIQLPKYPIKTTNIPIIAVLSLTLITSTSLLFKYNIDTCTQTSQQIICNIIPNIEQHLNYYMPVIILTIHKYINNWLQITQKIFKNRNIVAVTGNGQIQQLFQFGDQVRRFDILIIRYDYLHQKIQIIENILQKSNKKYCVIFDRFKPKNMHCQALRKLSYKKSIPYSIFTAKNKQKQDNEILQILQIKNPDIQIYDLDKLKSRYDHLLTNTLKPSTSTSTYAQHKQSIPLNLPQLYTIPIQQANTFTMSHLQRIIINLYVIQNGIHQLIQNPHKTYKILSKYIKTKKYILQKYTLEVYSQYIKLYMIVLKDCKKGIKEVYRNQMFFGIDPQLIYAKICNQYRKNRNKNK